MELVFYIQIVHFQYICHQLRQLTRSKQWLYQSLLWEQFHSLCGDKNWHFRYICNLNPLKIPYCAIRRPVGSQKKVKKWPPCTRSYSQKKTNTHVGVWQPTRSSYCLNFHFLLRFALRPSLSCSWCLSGSSQAHITMRYRFPLWPLAPAPNSHHPLATVYWTARTDADGYRSHTLCNPRLSRFNL